MDRKKELKTQYKQMRPEMGIFMIRSKQTPKYYLETAANLRSRINSTEVKLENGMHPNRELQTEWKEYGPEQFCLEILEHLDYKEDESKTDYAEELTLLQMIWEEKLAQQNLQFYRKSLTKG